RGCSENTLVVTARLIVEPPPAFAALECCRTALAPWAATPEACSGAWCGVESAAWFAADPAPLPAVPDRAARRRAHHRSLVFIIGGERRAVMRSSVVGPSTSLPWRAPFTGSS